eukprot:g12983.t1 g12983   contig7:607676-608680(+)
MARATRSKGAVAKPVKNSKATTVKPTKTSGRSTTIASSSAKTKSSKGTGRANSSSRRRALGDIENTVEPEDDENSGMSDVDSDEDLMEDSLPSPPRKKSHGVADAKKSGGAKKRDDGAKKRGGVNIFNDSEDEGEDDSHVERKKPKLTSPKQPATSKPSAKRTTKAKIPIKQDFSEEEESPDESDESDYEEKPCKRSLLLPRVASRLPRANKEDEQVEARKLQPRRFSPRTRLSGSPLASLPPPLLPPVHLAFKTAPLSGKTLPTSRDYIVNSLPEWKRRLLTRVMIGGYLVWLTIRYSFLCIVVWNCIIGYEEHDINDIENKDVHCILNSLST